MGLPFELAGMRNFELIQEECQSPHFGEMTALRSPGVSTNSRLPATCEGPVPWALLLTWATYIAGHYSDAPSMSIELLVPFLFAHARILFPAPPTCGIIP